jgi:DNA-binding winged helix-turn-helix (wHTH) protein
MIYSFGPFELDAESRRLLRAGDVVQLSDRHVDVLLQLTSQAGKIVTKDALIAAAWKDVAVTDNSLEQAISTLRRVLGPPDPPAATYIETLARRGYRFAVPITITRSRQSDEALASLLAPYRALVDGRAALETFDREAVARACELFTDMTRVSPDYAPAHLGLANALALAHESVRAEASPDDTALQRALRHGLEACRLDPSSGEAWATVSLLSHQLRDHGRAVAAAQRAAALEPDNWRHLLRLAYVSWGEPRLRAAHRVLKLLPDFPYAHWLAATVHVARQAFEEATHELVAGAAAQDRQQDETPFKGIGLHLLHGLVLLAQGDTPGARAEFTRELAAGQPQHIYGREACANAWCAIGALHLRSGRTAEAGAAFRHALQAVPGHVSAIAAQTALSLSADGGACRQPLDARLEQLRAQGATVEAALAEATFETIAGNSARAAHITRAALEKSPSNSAGWSIPVDPLLHVGAAVDHWASVLTLLRSRSL